MLNEALKNLGFSDKEISIYLCILENLKISATKIAKITSINRTTIYSVCKDLLAKGIITEDLGGVSRYYVALPPEELENIYKSEAEKIQQQKTIIQKILPELQALPKSKNYSVPKIRFIDELHLKDFLFKQLPIWIESTKASPDPIDKNWWGFQDASLLQAYSEFSKYFWEALPKDYGSYLFTNNEKTEQEFYQYLKGQPESLERRHMKYWPASKKFTATHVVLGDYVMFAITETHPHYLVEIHDAVMANNLREMFKAMWDKI